MSSRGVLLPRSPSLVLRLFLLLLALTLLLPLPTAHAYEQYLFDGNPAAEPPLSHIHDLDRATFQDIKARGEPWAIMFYSPTCGHCIHFAPIWAGVWGPLSSVDWGRKSKEEEGLGGLRLGAVSCVAENGVCQDENVNSYPTLKGFGLPEGKEGREGGREGVVTREHDEKKLVRWLTEKYTEAAAARAAAPAAAAPAAGKQTSFSIDDDGKTTSTAANAAAAAAALAGGKGPASVNTRTTAQGPGDIEAEARLSLPELKRARVEDAFTSLRFALDHDIFLGSKVLREESLSSLKDLLHVLSLLFPGKERRGAFRGLLEMVYPLEELSIREWEGFLALHLDPLAPTVMVDLPATTTATAAAAAGKTTAKIKTKKVKKKDYKWEVCRHDAGYTCGLWILFHLLSVKSAVRAESKAASSSTSIISPPYVMRVIRGFVAHFFGCQDCREHFLGAYEKVKPRWEEGGGKGAVWWVFDLHDKVNVRLGKRRWPTVEACPKCWEGEEVREGGEEEEEPVWEEVYTVMVEAYDVHDTDVLGGGRAGGREGGQQLGEMALLSRDYLYVSGVMLVFCCVFCLRMREKFRTGRRKKRDTMLPL